MSQDGQLTAVGISTNQWWLLVNGRVGVDFEFNPAEVADGEWPRTAGLSVDLQRTSAIVQSRSAEAYLEVVAGGTVSLTISLKDRCALPLPAGW